MDKPGLMQMVHDAARHAATRHAHIARNIANADTPGFRATDLPDFASSLEDAGFAIRATRNSHLDAGPGAGPQAIERTTQASPNGNNVSLEVEMMQATGAQAQHDMALSIYSSARDVLRASLGRK